MRLALTTLLLVVSALWWWGAWRLDRARRRVRSLPPSVQQKPERWPRISLIVPACNEEEDLERAVASRLADPYPDLEVVLVDDRSTDGTGPLVDRLAARDPRVKAVHVTALPEGWLGKVHALQKGIERATGEWLLLSDADIRFEPGTLKRAVLHAQAVGLEHLVALPRMHRSGVVLDATVDAFLGGMLSMIDLAAVEDPRSKAALGGGVFSMFRRAAYDRTPGLEWIRLEVADDLALGQMLKRAGARQGVVRACDAISLHWYRTVREMAVGMEKNLFGVLGGYRVGWLLVFATAMLVLALSPYFGIFLPIPLWVRAVCALTVVGVTWVRILSLRWLERPVLSGLLFPLGTVLVVLMALRSGFLALARGGVAWRGTLYSTRELRAHSRLERF